MGCNASKAFEVEPLTSPESQKPGIVTGDSFVGWLFGLPPSNATMHDSGYNSHSTTSHSGAVLAKEPASVSRKESISVLEKPLPSSLPPSMPVLDFHPLPTHQHQPSQQTGMAL